MRNGGQRPKMPVLKGRGEGLRSAVEDWQQIALGAGIAILAGPLTEIARYYLTRAKEREERQRTFQRDTLLAVLEHLSDAAVAAILTILDRKEQGFSEQWRLENFAVFEQHLVEADRYIVVVTDDEARRLTRAALAAWGDAAMAKSEAEADTRSEAATAAYQAATERIGKIVRGL
jgi:hypothetical protein